MLGNVRASRGGMRTRVTYRGRGRQISMRGPRRGGRGMGRGGAQATVKQKDPCSVYVSFVNPIEAVCAAELLEVAKGAKATVKFGRHCYLTFGTESESSASLAKASEKEFGGQKAYVDHAYKSQSAKAGGKREAEVTVQASPTKKLKINTSGPKVEKEAVEKVEKMEEDTTEVEEEGKEEEEEEEMADNGAEEAA